MSGSEIVGDRLVAKWLRDLVRLLPIRSQFVLSGQVRDWFLVPHAGAHQPLPALGCLLEALRGDGYEFLVRYDKVDGASMFPPDSKAGQAASAYFGLQSAGVVPASLTALGELARKVVAWKDGRTALVIDYASRLPVNAKSLQPEEQKFFALCEKLSAEAQPLFRDGQSLFNPIVWLVNRIEDLPVWLTLHNPRVQCSEVESPGADQRLVMARMLLKKFAGASTVDPPQAERYAKVFADLTDRLTLVEMNDIGTLARREGLELEDIDDAVRGFKSGDRALDNPWKGTRVIERIREAEQRIRDEVLGQEVATRLALDILKRSVMGLTGAQAGSSPGRPRGILFLAGPTGVGKTELAKQLHRCLFGESGSPIRFDMSEFSAEHADARLLGAPPGYVGYEGGGELINAVRQRPFSVILFDEIEKANARILDKFLQVLEDGRLTGGRGDTVHFSESIIVFTSNLGMTKEVPGVPPGTAQRVPTVPYGSDYAALKEAVLGEIRRHFIEKISRPELLNRFGDNIVVFDFIRPDVAIRIFDKMLRSVQARVQDEHKVRLVLAAKARGALLGVCTADLASGGRGIGSNLETALVNPLARQLFAESASLGGKEVRVNDVAAGKESFELDLEIR